MRDTSSIIVQLKWLCHAYLLKICGLIFPSRTAYFLYVCTTWLFKLQGDGKSISWIVASLNKFAYETLRPIWYHLYNLKNMKNTHGWVLLLVKLQASAGNFTKSSTLPVLFSYFLNCTNGTRSGKASHI